MSEYKLSWCDQGNPLLYGRVGITPEQAESFVGNLTTLTDFTASVLESAGVEVSPPLIIGIETYAPTKKTEVDSLPRHTDPNGQEVISVPIRPSKSRYVVPWRRNNRSSS